MSLRGVGEGHISSIIFRTGVFAPDGSLTLDPPNRWAASPQIETIPGGAPDDPDGRGWTRFWLLGAVPIVRVGGDADFARPAAARSIAESAFWLPTALLPSRTIRWEPLGSDRARVRVMDGPWQHQLDLTVGPDGRALAVSILRWSRENPQRRWQLQPFGGTPSAFRQVQGYRIATRIEDGNWFGTPDYFPFYRARITHAEFH